MEVSLRPLGQHDSAGPEGSTPHPSAPVFHTGALGSLNAGLTPGDSQLRGPGGAPLVAPYTQPHIRGSFLGPGPGVDGGDRCFILRVGRSPGRPDGFWHLASPMAVQAHKLTGTAGSLAHAETFSVPGERYSSRDSVGQLNDSVLHKQAGRHSLPVAVQTSPRSLGLVRPAPDHSYCSAPSGSGQRPSGRTVQGKLLPHRVEPAQTDLHVTMAGVGPAIRRHVRDGQKLPAASVLLSGSGSPGQRNKCADHELGSDLRICVSPDRSVPRVLRKLLRHPTATIVLIAPFWPSQIWFRQLTNLLIDVPRRLPDRSNLLRNSKTHELYPEPAKVDCMETVRRSILAQGFSASVADTASKGRRESTRRVYNARIRHFSNWCAPRSVDPYSAPVTEIADFLSDLAKSTPRGKLMAVFHYCWLQNSNCFCSLRLWRGSVSLLPSGA